MSAMSLTGNVVLNAEHGDFARNGEARASAEAHDVGGTHTHKTIHIALGKIGSSRGVLCTDN